MKYANKLGYTDVTPFEVVKEISVKTLEVREMKCERDTSIKLDFHVGGFSANCSNQDKQKWIIEQDENSSVIRIRLNSKGQWKDKNGNRYSLKDKPIKFYDYNF